MGGSRANTTQTTENTQELQDSRVGADNGAFAIGSGVDINVNQEFSKETGEAIRGLIDLTTQAVARQGQAGQALLASGIQNREQDNRVIIAIIAAAAIVAAIFLWRSN